MILKNLMEEKQLDFNQPLLSVRRFSSTMASDTDNKRKTDNSSTRLLPLPVYKSDSKSGPIANPGTVPFVWEQTPGRPKNDSKSQKRAVDGPSVAPKLPPGRVLKLKQKDSGNISKGTSVTQSRRTRTEGYVSNSQNILPLDDKVTKPESPEEGIQEKASSGSDDGDEAYHDALDTLSRTESFFMSCSVSGLSEWDDQEVQPSGSFSTDQQARDFMIGRFLPAAKAMASETPHFTSRKPLVTREETSPVKKAPSGERSHPINPHWQKVLPHYAQDIGREEIEDESDDENGSENYAPKVCGLFPRFCILNPIPGIRMEDRVLSSTVCGAAKKHTRNAYYGKKSLASQSGFTEEKVIHGIPEKSNHGIVPHRRGWSKVSCESTQCGSNCESPVVEKTLYVDSVHKVRSSSSHSSEMKGPTKDRGNGFETLRKDSDLIKNLSIDSPFENGKHLPMVNEKETLQPKSSESLDSFLPICSDNSSNDMQMEMSNHSNQKYSEKQGLSKPGYQGSDVDQDLVSSPKTVEYKKIESASEVSSCQRSSGGLIQNPVSWRNLKSQRATKLVDEESIHGSVQDPNTLASTKMIVDGKLGLKSQPHQGTSDASYLKLPLALPLPKAPSESWLKRTLPTASSKSISSQSNLAANINVRTQAPKITLMDPKWEKIVKSSNVHDKELLAPIPEA